MFGAVVLAVATLLFFSPASAQPDPRQMSGIPLPDPQLPAGTITVRVVRGTLSNNVPDQAVELREGDNVATAVTNAEGRAEFLTLNPGATVVAATELDGVRLESQPFSVPGQGGIRLMLVGGADPALADAPAEAGTVNFGADSRIVIELGEEVLNVYYLLDIVNWRDAPVEPDTPVALSLPAGATGTTLMGGSSPRAVAAGAQVSVPGPFPPGMTPLRVGFVLPYTGGSLAFDQPLPVALESLLLMVEKWGDMDIASEQIARRADASPEGTDGRTFIFAAGPAGGGRRGRVVGDLRPAAPQPAAGDDGAGGGVRVPGRRRLGRRDAGPFVFSRGTAPADRITPGEAFPRAREERAAASRGPDRRYEVREPAP